MHPVHIDSVLKDNLKDLNLGDFMTVCFYVIDEIYQDVKHLAHRPGSDPNFSDRLVICLNLVGQMVSDSENGWYKLVC